jgi:hypothetical protein
MVHDGPSHPVSAVHQLVLPLEFAAFARSDCLSALQITLGKPLRHTFIQRSEHPQIALTVEVDISVLDQLLDLAARFWFMQASIVFAQICDRAEFRNESAFM